MYKSLLCFLFFIGLFVLISCNKEKLKSPQASFLVANATQLTTNSSQGSNSHKITDLWLYVNDQFQGAYPVGSVMPIVAKDNADILLYPGIKNNGISATRIPYPFYKSIKLNQSITAGNTYTITPDFTYVSGLHFLANDSFDFSGGSNFTSVGDSAYTLTSDPYRTYGGSGKSVFMSMSDTKSSAEIRTSTPQDLPAGGATIYLEMDYKCNQTISVGVIGGGE